MASHPSFTTVADIYLADKIQTFDRNLINSLHEEGTPNALAF